MLRRLTGIATASLLLIWSGASAQTTDNVSRTADKLREGHVLRSFQACKQRGQSDGACKQELETLLQRDQKALGRIASLSTTANKTELVIAAARCYDPDFDYAQMIDCREAIADDLEAQQQLPRTAALPEPATSDGQGVSTAVEETRQEEAETTVVTHPVSENGPITIPKRRPPRFTDIEWASFLGEKFREIEQTLTAQADCSIETLLVPLPEITNKTTVGENFWRPVSGKPSENNPEFDDGSGLQTLTCDFESLARANMLFHQGDGEIFRVDIFFQRYRCDDLGNRTCFEETVQERGIDRDLYLSAGSPVTRSAFGTTEIENQEYLERFADLLTNQDQMRRLNWSNCATVPAPLLSALEGTGTPHHCVVQASAQDDIWRSISFLEIAPPEAGSGRPPSMLASKMTFAREVTERTALDRHMIYFQTIVGNRLASASSDVAKEHETPNETLLIKEVRATDTIVAKPTVETPSASSGDQRDRMKVILERLIGLSP